VLEQLALLPVPIPEDDLALLGDRACDLMEARGLAIHGEKPTIETLVRHRRGLLREGHDLAALGMAVLIVRWSAEMELKASSAPLN
jgi:hypothetical protein